MLTERNQYLVKINVITNRPHVIIAKNGIEPARMRGTPHAVIATVVVRIGRAPGGILLRLIGNTDSGRNRCINPTDNIGINAPPPTLVVVAIATGVQVDTERFFTIPDGVRGAIGNAA